MCCCIISNYAILMQVKAEGLTNFCRHPTLWLAVVTWRNDQSSIPDIPNACAPRFTTLGAIVWRLSDVSQGLVRNMTRSGLLTARVLLPITKTPPHAYDLRLPIHMKHHSNLALLFKPIRFHLPTLLYRIAEPIPVILSTPSETMAPFVP